MAGYGGGVCAHAKPSSGDLFLRSPRRPCARGYGGETADLHGDARRIDHLVNSGESAALVLGQAADFRQREEVLTSSGSPALLVVWAILGAFFVWSLVTIASAAWLPVLYCAAVYLFVTRF
jgi:hypothetical protein